MRPRFEYEIGFEQDDDAEVFRREFIGKMRRRLFEREDDADAFRREC